MSLTWNKEYHGLRVRNWSLHLIFCFVGINLNYLLLGRFGLKMTILLIDDTFFQHYICLYYLIIVYFIDGFNFYLVIVKNG